MCVCGTELPCPTTEGRATNVSVGHRSIPTGSLGRLSGLPPSSSLLHQAWLPAYVPCTCTCRCVETKKMSALLLFLMVHDGRRLSLDAIELQTVFSCFCVRTLRLIRTKRGSILSMFEFRYLCKHKSVIVDRRWTVASSKNQMMMRVLKYRSDR